MNPEGRYSREEMIFLHDVRAAKKRNEGMTFALPTHAMDILDVRLKDNHWFILVRDTNNMNSHVYEKDEEGNLKSSSDPIVEGKGGFALKREIRNLNGNLTSGMLGTSWWELKDVFENLLLYGNAPRIERDDNKGKLLGFIPR